MAGKSRRGFASMDPAKQKEIASKGGRAAHEKGTAHEWSSDEARNAGKKGGEVVSRDRTHMAAIGREGGEARGRKARERKGGTQPAMAAGTSAAPTSPSFREREVGTPISREIPAMAASDLPTSSGNTERARPDSSRSEIAESRVSATDQDIGR